MPNPNEAVRTPASAAQEAMIARLTGGVKNDLASEISALRADIAELRAALVPVPSLILTGQQALDEFKRLTEVPK